jgi:quercetin dioxygenase-like cupin family protein
MKQDNLQAWKWRCSMSAGVNPAKTTIKKNFDNPEEVRSISKGKVEVVNLGEVTAMRATFEPGWRWSESVKPIAATKSCEVAHMGYMLSGRMMVKMDDGPEFEFRPGDVALIPPRHDAWVVGNEPVVFIDFQGGSTYAKPQR